VALENERENKDVEGEGEDGERIFRLFTSTEGTGV